MNDMPWKPTWWNEQKHGSAFDRVKVAMARDWAQTKKDFGAKTGKELHQDAGDTVKQMTGAEPVPPMTADAEMPMGYGYAAKHQYGATHPTWNQELEGKLKTEWDLAKDKTGKSWDQVRDHVRYGYDYKAH